jgi:DNA polymerase-1
LTKYIAAVDADVIAYRVAAACQEETQETMIDTIRAFVFNMMHETQCQEYCLLLTGSNNFRYEVAKTKPYKGNRKEVERPKWLSDARQYLVDHYKALIVEGYEADDACASLADRYSGSSMIISVDKDLKQVPCYFYDPVKKVGGLVTDAEAQYNLAYQMLKGDNTDNIPGLPRIGEVKAIQMLKNHPAPMHKVSQVYQELGFDYDYYYEQLQLLRMRKDLILDYEAHFITQGDISHVDLEFPPLSLQEEFDF